MAKRRLQWGVLAAAFASATAFAQVEPEPPEVSREDVTPSFAEEWRSVGVMARGGVGDYTGGLGQFTAAGPAWGVTATGAPSRFFGFELSYAGSSNPLVLDAMPDEASLVRNGVTGLAKVNAVINETIRPFAGVGVGVTYVDPTSNARTFFTDDFMTEIPFAVGVDWQPLGALTVGARGDWSYLSGEGWAETAIPLSEDNPNGGLWTGQVTVGGEF